MATHPRLVVAGLSGDSGKTLVSLGLLLMAAERGLPVRGFKKGPDYIDAAWLTWASGQSARNLDTYLMGFNKPTESFVRHATTDGLNIVEGNRGLFDGSDPQGTHSTAELAKTLNSPVLLALTVTKVTRTAAASVLGCQKLDPEVHIAGVVLNRVATSRHERVVTEAIESACGIPVVGVIPKAKGHKLLPGRHLGLVTPAEHPRISEVRDNVLDLVGDSIDFNRVLDISHRAPKLPNVAPTTVASTSDTGLKIGYLCDSAFTFYYPENLEALTGTGATLVPISAIEAPELPSDLDALYIGGGFPETHGARLAANTAFLASLRNWANKGLPIYAECGGLMLLSRAIQWDGIRHPMAGVLPFDVEVHAKPQGHGYADLAVDHPNPYFAEGTRLQGHEFHYSRVVLSGDTPSTVCSVQRGTGCFDRRDGVLIHNVFAAYTHLHALATSEWAAGVLAAARRYAKSR